MNEDPEDRRVCVCWGGGVIWEEGSRSRQPSRLAGGKVWPAPKTGGNFSSPPQTLFLRRNKVNLLKYSIPRTVPLFLLSP